MRLIAVPAKANRQPPISPSLLVTATFARPWQAATVIRVRACERVVDCVWRVVAALPGGVDLCLRVCGELDDLGTDADDGGTGVCWGYTGEGQRRQQLGFGHARAGRSCGLVTRNEQGRLEQATGRRHATRCWFARPLLARTKNGL